MCNVEIYNSFGCELPKIACAMCNMTAVEYVQARMGHRNISTTLQYLNYKSRLQWRNKIQHEYESSLMKYVQSSVNLAGDLS